MPSVDSFLESYSHVSQHNQLILAEYCRQGPNDAYLETGDMSRRLPHFKKWAELEKSIYANLKS